MRFRMNALPGDFLAETFLRYLSPYRRSYCASIIKMPSGLRKDMQGTADETERPRSFGRVPPSAA
jgi:hypothetical protein